MCPTTSRWTSGAIPSAAAVRMSTPGVAYPVHDATANSPTSRAASPASASALPTASLPIGSASVTYRRIRSPVDQRDTSSTSGFTAR